MYNLNINISKKTLVFGLILLLAIMFRITPQLMYGHIYGTDGWAHASIANHISEEEHLTFTYPNGKLRGYSVFPGQQVFISILQLILQFDSYNISAYILPILASMFWVVFAYLITKEVYNDNATCTIAAFLAALSSPHIDRVIRNSYDTLGVSFYIIALYLMLRYFRTQRTKYLVYYSIIFLVSSVTHHLSAFLLILMSLSTVIYFFLLDKKTHKKHILLGFITQQISAIILTLWFFTGPPKISFTRILSISTGVHESQLSPIILICIFSILIINLLGYLYLNSILSSIRKKSDRVITIFQNVFDTRIGRILLVGFILLGTLVYYYKLGIYNKSTVMNIYIFSLYIFIFVTLASFGIKDKLSFIPLFWIIGISIPFFIGLFYISFPLIPIRHMTYFSIPVVILSARGAKKVFDIFVQRNRPVTSLVIPAIFITIVFLTPFICFPFLKGIDTFQSNDQEVFAAKFTQNYEPDAQIHSDGKTNSLVAALGMRRTTWGLEGSTFFHRDQNLGEAKRRIHNEWNGHSIDYVVLNKNIYKYRFIDINFVSQIVDDMDRIYDNGYVSIYNVKEV